MIVLVEKETPNHRNKTPPSFKEPNQPCQREVKVANGATLKISKKEQTFLIKKKWAWDRRAQLPSNLSFQDLHALAETFNFLY